jgi:hypothetical protein
VKGPVAVSVPAGLSGAQCSAFVPVGVPIRSGGGQHKAGKSRVTLKGTARAPKGTMPRTDKDRWTLQCLPNPDPATCPGG